MHVVNLGLGYDCNGASMRHGYKAFLKTFKISCSQPPFKAYMAARVRLAHFLGGAYELYCNRCGSLTNKNVHGVGARFLPLKVFKKHGYVLFTTKAYNGRVISEWLSRCLSDAAARPNELTDPDGELPLLAACMKFGSTSFLATCHCVIQIPFSMQ